MPKASNNKKSVETLTHDEATRKNIPTTAISRGSSAHSTRAGARAGDVPEADEAMFRARMVVAMTGA